MIIFEAAVSMCGCVLVCLSFANLRIFVLLILFVTAIIYGLINAEVAFLQKMSLISQNVVPKDQTEKVKRKAYEQPSLLEADQEIEDRKENKLVTYKIKKRNEERKKEDKMLEIEEGKKMKKLENFLFGSLYSPVEFREEDDEELREDGVDKGSALFFTDKFTNSVLSVYEKDAKFRESSDDEEEAGQRKPVWVDDEEEKASIIIAKVRLRKLRKEEDEILARSYNDVEGVDNILRTNEDLVVKSSVKLLPGLLEYSRLVEANADDLSNSPINSVQFHRNAQLLLTAGLEKKLRFFQLDGKRNTKIQSIFLDDCPIQKACFLPDGSQVIASGRRKFFYSFNLVKATEGYILLVSSKTKELIGTFKMNGTARSLVFANDGQHLLSSGGDGHVYHWDLRTRACFHKAIDEGCIHGSSLCTSPDGSLFAAGSDSGIANVYNREEFLGGKRKPIKAIENLHH
ncbi:hypothetical protein TEA_009685 [Camellia sinensis var. sinensis]|uniref:Uncharacterized protein n=1 Tax=Camellia sinensis var. sinensis TaxID=542762 RepID=A0A4S4EJJ3_CAMSN|nr:hypothetical protein TEA_009685 [Camellia sinensis var. sinensis]